MPDIWFWFRWFVRQIGRMLLAIGDWLYGAGTDHKREAAKTYLKEKEMNPGG